MYVAIGSHVWYACGNDSPINKRLSYIFPHSRAIAKGYYGRFCYCKTKIDCNRASYYREDYQNEGIPIA